MTKARVRLIGIVGAVAFATLVVVVYGSPWFKVSTIDVTGDAPELHEGIAASLEGYLDRPLHTVDGEEISEAIGRDYPAVREVRTARSWPQTLSVDVVARTPVMVLSAPRQTSLWVDAGGAVFPAGESIPGLPALRLGASIGTDERAAAISDAARVRRGAPPEAIDRLVRIEVVSRDDIRLVLKDDAVVRWGSAEDGRRKALVLAALLRRDAVVYDVSAPDLPTTKSS